MPWRRIGGIAPRIFDLGTRWRWVVSFTPLPLYPQGKSPFYPLDRRLGKVTKYDQQVSRLKWNCAGTRLQWTCSDVLLHVVGVYSWFHCFGRLWSAFRVIIFCHVTMSRNAYREDGDRNSSAASNSSWWRTNEREFPSGAVLLKSDAESDSRPDRLSNSRNDDSVAQVSVSIRKGKWLSLKWLKT
jgi:hypothetical protein